MTKTLTRRGRMARRGAKGWIGWRATKSALPRRMGGRPSGRTVTSFASGIGLGLLLSRLDKRRRHMAADHREYDDTTLARKVESELFRPADVPKGKISVNVAHGVVELRGELDDPQQIESLAKSAERVEGVKGVRNLLHTPSGNGQAESAPTT